MLRKWKAVFEYFYIYRHTEIFGKTYILFFFILLNDDTAYQIKFWVVMIFNLPNIGFLCTYFNFTAPIKAPTHARVKHQYTILQYKYEKSFHFLAYLIFQIY